MVDQGRIADLDGRKRPADPVAIAVLAALTVGWRFKNATTIATATEEVSLIKTSPAALKKM